MARDFYPICLDITDRLAVVVGGGEVAERKTRGLLECGAEVRVVAPEATPALTALAQKREIEWLRREFHPGDIEKAFLVFAATDSAAVNTRVCQACDVAGVLVNRVESPEASDFIVPVTLRRGAFTLSIATGGASPHLGQAIRERLAGEFGPEYEAYIGALEKARAEIMQTIADPETRRRILRSLAEDSEMLEIARRDGKQAALARARSFYQTA